MTSNRHRHSGFSLTEVLLAAGILVVGFLLIAGVLPVGVKLTAMSTERSIGAVAADEAFAKIRLLGVPDVALWNKPWGPGPSGLGVDPNTVTVDYATAWFDVGGVDLTKLPDGSLFAYPSCDVYPDTKRYYWSAICRYEDFDLGLDSFQVTVFVSRHTGLNVKYPMGSASPLSDYPRAVAVPVTAAGTGLVNRIAITDPLAVDYVTDESTLVDGRTGQIMRVLSRNKANPSQILLEDKLFDAGFGDRFVWVVPPATGSGRYPCVGVYQRMVKFK